MALLKLFNPVRSSGCINMLDLNSWRILKRCCHWNMTQDIPKGEEIPKYEVCTDEKSWQFVEQLLPTATIPSFPERKYYPSGWKPQKLHQNMPYFVHRSKNHMLPVYLKISHHGMRRITMIRRVHGDMHKMAADIHKFLVNVNHNKVIGIKVVETCGRIDIHGDHVSNVKLWLERRNM